LCGGAFAQSASTLQIPFETWTIYYVLPVDAFPSVNAASTFPNIPQEIASNESFHGVSSWLAVRQNDRPILEEAFSLQRERLLIETAVPPSLTNIEADRARLREISLADRLPSSRAASLDEPGLTSFDTHYLIDRMVYYVTPSAVGIPAMESTVVPEPTAVSLLVVGLAALCFAKRR
jgi:hypothetical protein